jgi:type IV pilus biogenesis protein CpaD/CtpE
MMPGRVVIALVALATLGGCASREGCTGYACKRPDSTDRQLVVWWPEDMRQGLNDRDPEVDFTVVPLKD